MTIIQNNGTPEIYVADCENVRLQVFTLEGEYKRSVASDDLRYPCCVTEKDGFRYIPDLFSRVTILDAQDKLVGHLGDYPGAKDMENWPDIEPSKRITGKFISPHALWLDSHNDLYLVEWIKDGRITKLKRGK